MWAVTSGSVTNASTASGSPQRGHVVTSGPQTLRSSDAQSSRRATVIAEEGGGGVPASDGAFGVVGTTLERQRWADEKIP